MGARARQQWRYGNYRIHPSRASHLATLGDYGVIESRSEAFGDGFLSVAALWIILGKRGQTDQTGGDASGGICASGARVNCGREAVPWNADNKINKLNIKQMFGGQTHGPFITFY